MLENQIIINNTPVQIKEYNGVRVVTLKDIDTVHGRPDGTARKRFNENKKRFIEGEDYFTLNQPSEIRTLGITRPQGGVPESVRLTAQGNETTFTDHALSIDMAKSGDESQLAASGDESQLAASGDESQLAASGYGSQLAASGDESKLSAGENSVICCAGHGCKAKAKKGSWITLSEWEYSQEKQHYVPKCVKTEYVDGEKIKADTWYKLQDGEFVEVKQND